MHSSLRLIQLIKIRNQTSTKTLRNYVLYFALILFITYHLAQVENSAHIILLVTMSLASIYCAERQFFPQVKDTMNSIHFLTTPSQQWEKWLAEFIHTFILIPIIAISPVLAAFFIVDFFSSSTTNLKINPNDVFFSLKTYWFAHPILFFGAVYFRNTIVVKTFGSVALLAIASTLFVAALTKLFPPFNHLDAVFLNQQLPILAVMNHPRFFKVAVASYFIFFWLMSYLSLTETESS